MTKLGVAKLFSYVLMSPKLFPRTDMAALAGVNLKLGPFFKKIIFKFICDCTGSLLLHGLSLVAVASGGYSLAVVHRCLLAVASLVEHRL